jgi:hypothetical protein
MIELPSSTLTPFLMFLRKMLLFILTKLLSESISPLILFPQQLIRVYVEHWLQERCSRPLQRLKDTVQLVTSAQLLSLRLQPHLLLPTTQLPFKTMLADATESPLATFPVTRHDDSEARALDATAMPSRAFLEMITFCAVTLLLSSNKMPSPSHDLMQPPETMTLAAPEECDVWSETLMQQVDNLRVVVHSYQQKVLCSGATAQCSFQGRKLLKLLMHRYSISASKSKTFLPQGH